MATPARVTRVKGLRGFWKEFKRVKRGVIGLAIICFYIVLGIIGPQLSPHDALFPRKPEYYPASSAPLADVLCMPAWYKYLPGGSDLSENMKLIPDHEFLSEKSIDMWSWTTDNPNYINLKYNSVEGDRDDGCIELSYRRETADTSPGTTYVNITHDFFYPYKRVPRLFWIHVSYRIDGEVSSDCEVTIELLFRRFQEPPPLVNYTYPDSLIAEEDSLIIYTYPLHLGIRMEDPPYLAYDKPIAWNNKWITSRRATIQYDPKYWLRPQEIIFPTSGNYTYEIKIGFHDKEGYGKDVTVYLDNLDILLYGEVYGLLGTDYKTGGPRDIATSMVYGARISIFVGLLATAISVSMGLVVGLLAGYIGGATDEILMRVADFLMCLPGLPLIIVLMVVLSSSIWNVILILAFLGWMGFSRSVRSMTLSLRERSFIEAARASGAGTFRIVFKHLLPNVFALVYISLATSVPGVILSEASLSWLGLYDPRQISWGRMLNEFSSAGVATTKGFSEYWFWVIPPGLAICILGIAFILLGYSLDEILNPKLRVRR